MAKVTPEDLKSEPKKYVNLFYIESFSIVNFLINKYGKYKFSYLLSYLKKGYNLEFKSDELSLSATAHTLPQAIELMDIVLKKHSEIMSWDSLTVDGYFE